MVRNLMLKFARWIRRAQPKRDIAKEIRDYGGVVGKNADLINCYIDLTFGWLLHIGDNVTITNATLMLHDASTKKALGYSKFGPISIGNDVYIGFNAIILPNTTIGDKVIIGAGCVVGKDIPSNSVVVGNPCRILCTYDEYMQKNKERMSNLPVFDCYPTEIEKEVKKTMFNDLINNGGGAYVK